MTFASRFIGFGVGNVVNPLVGGTYGDLSVDPTNCSCGLRFNVDGSIDILRTSLGNLLGAQKWFNPSGGSPGNNYWVRCTLTSGTVSGGSAATGSWLALSSSRLWQKTTTAVGLVEFTATIEIATDSGGTNIVSSGSFTIQAERGV